MPPKTSEAVPYIVCVLYAGPYNLVKMELVATVKEIDRSMGKAVDGLAAWQMVESTVEGTGHSAAGVPLTEVPSTSNSTLVPGPLAPSAATGRHKIP